MFEVMLFASFYKPVFYNEIYRIVGIYLYFWGKKYSKKKANDINSYGLVIIFLFHFICI